MTAFSIVDGLATIHDPELYQTWIDRPDYLDAVAASPDPDVAAAKRTVIDFEAELARLARDHAGDERLREVLERYVASDYIQHDPNALGNGRDALIEFLRHAPVDGPPPPTVVGVLVEGELASVMRRQPTPDPLAPGGTYDWYSLDVFRLDNGRLAEHWGALQKLPAGKGPM